MTYNDQVMLATEALFLGKDKDTDENGETIIARQWGYNGAEYEAWTPFCEESERAETWLIKVHVTDGKIINRAYRRVNFASQSRNWLQMVEKVEESYSLETLPVHVSALKTWADGQKLEFDAGIYLADTQTHVDFLEDLMTYGFSDKL